MESPSPEWIRVQAEAATVSLIQEAVRRARSRGQLIRDLAELGIEGRGGRPSYSDSAVRQWLKGESLPAAPVVFAVALHYGLRVDTFLWQDDLGAKVARLEQETTQLRRALEEVEDLVFHLAQHTRYEPAEGEATFARRQADATD